MLNYNDILDSGLVSESICKLLFTENERTQRSFFARRSLIMSSYRISVFYAALVQAYVIGRAIREGCDIDGLGYPKKLTESIKSTWQQARKNTKQVFSFLINCQTAENDLIDAESLDIIRELRSLYEDYVSPNKRPEPISENGFLMILGAFPLLKIAEADFDKMKFTFPINISDPDSERFDISIAPFVFFADNGTASTTNSVTEEGFVFSSAKKGEKNGELLFDVIPLYESDGQRCETVKIQASKNENLRIICSDALGLNTDWYDVEECWCDFAFLEHLTSTTELALKSFWEKSSVRSHRFSDENIAPKLLSMFTIGSAIYKKLEEKKTIAINDIDNVFYGLYVEYGVFKTTQELLLDYKNHEFGSALFDEYMKNFAIRGQITEKHKNDLIAECNKNISSRLKKLSSIVSESSSQYDMRSRFIKAEWRAFTVLRAAGIHADNLFTDEEFILSIDDYFAMIQNNSREKLTSDLNTVTSFLTSLYGALISLPNDFTETQFGAKVESIRTANKLKDTEELFRAFTDVVTASNGNESISKLLGRHWICDPEKLEFYIDEIRDNLNGSGDEKTVKKATKKSVFISYSRDDSEKVKKCVDMWTKKGYSVFFDVEAIDAGDNWRERAEFAINDKNCAAILVFMSKNAAKSKNVCYEIEHAKIAAETIHFPNDPVSCDRFIIPINLEDEVIGEYTNKLAHTLTDKLEKKSAMKICEALDDKSGYNYSTDMDKLDAKIKDLLLPNGDGDFIDRISDGLARAVSAFYTFLKYGDECKWMDGWDENAIKMHFNDDKHCISKCIYPLLASVKETKIKRDNITLMGYEIIKNKGEENRKTHYILSTKRLEPDDYLCIPNYRTIGEDGTWMVNPLLINSKFFSAKSHEDN